MRRPKIRYVGESRSRNLLFMSMNVDERGTVNLEGWEWKKRKIWSGVHTRYSDVA